MDKMGVNGDLSSREATGYMLDQHDECLQSKNSENNQSPTSTHSSVFSERSLVNSSSQHGSSVDTSAQPSCQFPSEVLSMLNEGFRDRPLPVSLQGPPAIHAPLLEKKIEWHGSWRDGWEPRWGATEPCIEDIRKTAKPFMQFCGINPDDFSIVPFRQGMRNKLYKITSENKTAGTSTECIFRVALPVDPWFKLQSEVATMEYVRQNTSIPIPRVYVFDSSMTNDLGFEWMIIENLDGKTYRDAKASMSQPMKENLHRTIAEWVDQLSKLRFDRIGSLYREWDSGKPNHLDFQLGPVTSDHFLGPWRTQKDVFRGPFRNEAHFYRSIVELSLRDVLDPRQLDLAKRAWDVEKGLAFVSMQEDGVESQEPTTVYSDEAAFKPSGVQNACYSVLDLLPSIDDKLAEQQRSYVLHHFDITQNNVLVDDTGLAVALLDWENLITESLSQIDPWPSIVDPTRYELPELPLQCNGPKPEWYLSALEDYDTRLAADAFTSHLRELKSSWPHTQTEAQEFSSEFEEDLAELGLLVKEIYAGWAELEICEKMKKKYFKMFWPISPHPKEKKKERQYAERKLDAENYLHSDCRELEY